MISIRTRDQRHAPLNASVIFYKLLPCVSLETRKLFVIQRSLLTHLLHRRNSRGIVTRRVSMKIAVHEGRVSARFPKKVVYEAHGTLSRVVNVSRVSFPDVGPKSWVAFVVNERTPRESPPRSCASPRRGTGRLGYP